MRNFLYGFIGVIVVFTNLLGCKKKSSPPGAPEAVSLTAFQQKVEDKSITLLDWSRSSDDEKFYFCERLTEGYFGQVEEYRFEEITQYFNEMVTKHSANLTPDLKEVMLQSTTLFKAAETGAHSMNWPVLPDSSEEVSLSHPPGSPSSQ